MQNLWSPEEIALLKDAVQYSGIGRLNFKTVANFVNSTKTAKQCREKWKNIKKKTGYGRFSTTEIADLKKYGAVVCFIRYKTRSFRSWKKKALEL